MSRRFTTNVWTTEDGGAATFHAEGSKVPEGCQVGDHCWAEVDDSYLDDTTAPSGNDPVFEGEPEQTDGDADGADGEGGDGPLQPPPTAGPGASRQAWRDYYTALTGQRPHEDWTRDDLIEEVGSYQADGS